MSIINGNCLDIIKTIKEEFIIVTDPPFNVNYHYDDYADSLSVEDYNKMLKTIFNTPRFVVIHYPEELYKIAILLKKSPERVVSWIYNSNTPRQHRDIAYFGVTPDFSAISQPYKNPTDKRIAQRILEGKTAKGYDWWEADQVKNISNEKTEHPCQMPLKVMVNIIKTLPKDILITDPFAGSGTTLLACEMNNRKYIGIEISKKYCDIATQRINNYKNQLNLFDKPTI